MNIARWESEYVGRLGAEIGIIADGRGWTNSELHERARRLARVLVERGLEPGDRVALALPNCVELFVASSAVWIAGGAVVVMAEPSQSELVRMVEHCEARVLITRSASRPGLDVIRHQIIVRPIAPQCSDALNFDALIEATAPLESPVPRDPADVAQLCYTSGSTGNPKAVVYTHGGMDEYWRATARGSMTLSVVTSEANVAILAIPPTAFGARFLGMRIAANTRYILQEGSSPEGILAAIERYRAGEVSLVPTLAEQLATFGSSREFDTTSLKRVHLGGAHISRRLVRRLKERFATGTGSGAQEASVFVHYGLTESGGGVANTHDGGDGVVGRPLPNVDVRIIDRAGRQVGAGESGEIIVHSPFAAAGYWRDSRATAAVFRDGYVHTGDLGCFNERGELCVVGRLKEVIIQGGYNIVAAELVAVIANLEGLTDCAVVGLPDELLGEEVVACVVRAPGARITEAAIRAQCRQMLNPRKQPARILFLEKLPRTHSGKLDTRTLKLSIGAMSASLGSGAFMGHLHSLEPGKRMALVAETIEAALVEVLYDSGTHDALHRRVCADVPFGELGLDSIGSVRVARLLSDRLGASVSPTLMYSSPTVSALAERLHTLLFSGEKISSSAQAGEAAERAGKASSASIAIIGMGCRLPGSANSPDALWSLLYEGRDAVREASDARRGDSAAPWRAAFLDAPELFDARFFRLAHASDVDPRHRMVLEVAWEALEDAGCNPLGLEQARTGVFLGIYGTRYRGREALATAPAMAAAYLCQFLNIRGPVISIDTTCSSSLVAVHSAVNSLRLGECDLAIAGGVNLLMPVPEQYSLGVIAPDGRSKAFDASADGFGQGEGCVLLVLRRLTDTQVNGDRIYASILATAINHDGRSSSLTAPNARAQEEVIRRVLSGAGVSPDSVQYVEAHGTGTLLGDPIEVEALASVFGERTTQPLRIGSIKTNLGHLEAAAGVAGLAKAALAITRRRLPPSLNFSRPNPHIPWAQIPIRVNTEATVWPDPSAPLIAGVSSFGMSGTNAHVLVREAPTHGAAAVSIEPEASTATQWALPLSAGTPQSLHAAAAEWARALSGDAKDTSVRDIAFTASCGRAHLHHRAVFVGRTRQDWVDALQRFVATARAEICGEVSEPRRKLVMVFSGQGPQWWGMGRQLYAREPIFRNALDQCAQLIDARVSWRLLEELGRDEATSRIDDTEIAQPALFALQVALVELWKSWGVEPTGLVGHSLGEIAAAHFADVMTLEQAASLVCERGRLLKKAAGKGTMAAVGLSLEDASRLCAEIPGKLEVAAHNGPASCTLSGDTEAVMLALSVLKARGISARRLRVSCAFHSQHVESTALELSRALAGLSVGTARIPLYSTVTGGPAPAMDAGYWGAQCHRRVCFYPAIAALLANGATAFVEVGPHPALIHSIAAAIEERGGLNPPVVVASLQRECDEQAAMTRALAQLHCAGYPVEWSRYFQRRGRVVSLPTYRWDHEPHWHTIIPRTQTPARDREDGERRVSVRSISRDSLWAQIRGEISAQAQLPPQSIRDDQTFDALGLDSLAILRLRAQLSAVLEVPIASAAVGPGSTLAQLVESIQGQISVERTAAPDSPRLPLEWLRRDGADPVCCWIHPVGGGVGCYRPLARKLPFASVAVAAPTLREGQTGADSIEVMARRYLDLLAANGLGSPAVLGGWSLGGLLALEMGIQLRARGAAAPLIVAMDTHLNDTASPTRMAHRTILRSFVQDYLGAATASELTAERLDTYFSADGAYAGKLGDVVKEVIHETALPPIPVEDAERLLNIFQTNLKAGLRYQPAAYAGSVLLIRAASSGEALEQRWRRVVASLDVEHVEADHYSMMQHPVIETVAERILSRIREPA
jgi:acyl transferase domain-containing protein/acyl-CoA synthetase (AMP-forming)/AMP-acid ligase II/thioesterase domain-containing protein